MTTQQKKEYFDNFAKNVNEGIIFIKKSLPNIQNKKQYCKMLDDKILIDFFVLTKIIKNKEINEKAANIYKYFEQHHKATLFLHYATINELGKLQLTFEN